MKILRRVLVIACIVGVVALLTLFGATCALDRKMRMRTDEVRAAAKADYEAARERFLADQQALAAHWLFARKEGGGDASPVLEPRTGWRGPGLERPAQTGVPPALDEQLKEWKREWAAHVDDAALDGLDLAWMKELARFDHWDLEAETSPMNRKPWRFYDAPLPNFIALQSIAKARLLVGLRDGNPREAAMEVRELARLAASTESLVGAMVAVSIVRTEMTARAAAEARKLDVSDWPATTDDEAARLKRTLWASTGFFQAMPIDEGAEAKVVVGRCSALMEGGSGALFLRGLLEHRYADRYASLGRSINDAPCRLKNLRRAWNAGDDEGELPVNGDLFCTAASLNGDAPPSGCHAVGAVLWLPFVKEAIGEVLLSISSPSWFKDYLSAASPLR